LITYSINMKKVYLLFYLLFIVFSGFNQITDDFSDGNLNSNPSWQGDVNSFTVNSSLQLQLDETGSGTKYLSLPSNNLNNSEWQFYVKLDFSPSNNNFVKLFLAADQIDLNNVQNGYFIRIGENLTEDGVDLYKIVGGSETKIIDGHPGWGSTSPELRIKVKNDNAGNWELYVDTLGGKNFVLDASINDNSIISSSYFGILCNFTSSNSKGFTFDDFYVGPEIIDNSPPEIKNIQVTDNKNINLSFNEPIESNSLKNSSFSIDPGSIAIESFNVSTSLTLINISLKSELQSPVDYTLTINNIEDLAGNKAASLKIDFTYLETSFYDVVFNEIMPDPNPPQQLPDAEFIELKNNLSFDVDMTNWTISDATSTETFPSFILEKNAYIILCNTDDTTLFQNYGEVIGMDLPSLNNSGDDLILKNNFGVTIDSISYTTSWYKDDNKSGGGFSLEKKDPDNICLGENNWQASNHFKGGTPGNQNSVYEEITDVTPPKVDRITTIGNKQLKIFFSEKMDKESISDLNNFRVLPLNISPNNVLPENNNTEAILTFVSAFEKNIIFELEINILKDCAQNSMNEKTIVKFGFPSEVDSGDVVINEILFNPYPGAYDYVEILNISDKILDLNDLLIGRYSDEMLLEQINSLTEESYLFFPNDFIVISENTQSITSNYFVKNPEYLITIKDLPSFNDDEGFVVLLNQNMNLLDQFHYSEDMHFEMIDDPEGVSLEKINPYYPSYLQSNWHSAASSVNYGTPTYQNSQFKDINPANDEVVIDPKVFSPDGDGYQDIVTIKMRNENSGDFGSINIYDISGRHIREISNNDLFGAESFYSWDGIDNNGENAPTGVYIILIEYINQNGDKLKTKKTVTLHRK
jgi:hypothetical protein